MKRFAAVLPLVLFALHAQTDKTRFHFLGAKEPLTGPSARAAREIAREYIDGIASQLNLNDTDLAGLYVAKEYKTSHNGVSHLVYHQRFRGVDVLNASWVVNIDSDGRVLNSGGFLYPAPAPGEELPPQSSAFGAVRAALREVNPAIGDSFAPFVSEKSVKTATGVRFAAGPFPEEIPGELVWYGVNGSLHPAWQFAITDVDRINSFETVVDDATQLILSKKPTTFFQQAPRGLVFERESPQPNATPGVRLTGPPPVVDRILQPFTGDPVASPKGWVTGGETVGNNVIAGENQLGIQFLLTPNTAKAADNNFSFPLELGPGAPNPLSFGDAATTNLFYWMNRAHDLHYQSGFDEAAGNFQQENFDRGGVGGDPIYAYSHYGANSLSAAQIENAFFSLRTVNDGSQAMVAMFLSASNQGDFFTDGSYDAVVMVHEYTHGVSFRLVQDGYNTFQGAAMGEAWSDFYGIEFTLPDGTPPDGFYAEGEYFTQDWGAGNLRTRGYSTNLDLNPLTYANLGHVIPQPEVHADGEIWFEALWDVRANLIKQFGEQEGRRRARLLVMDGMKLSIPAPSMVDMRDAILLADRTDFKGASQDQIWTAFAKRGLGALAYSTTGHSVHVMSSFDMPSSSGQIKFYDDPFVIGEQVRIVVQDSSYSQPTLNIQVASSSGDIENVALKKTGSIYTGIFGTTGASTDRFSGALSLVPGDFISAYYTHAGPPGPSQQISTYVGTIPPYTFSTTAPLLNFGPETALRLTGSTKRVDLPFDFPFFANKYSFAYVYRNGLITFDFPTVRNGCTDRSNLAGSIAIAPLWLNLSVTGVGQPKEDVYTSRTADSITFHWIGETRTPFTGPGTPGSPVNFAATLFNDGRIEFHYGPGNLSLADAITASGCGPGPAVGVSNGHEFTQTILRSGFDGAPTFHFDPPYGYGSLPVAKLEIPAPDQHFQGVLQVTGVAYDPGAPISRIDVFIDGVFKARTTATVNRPDFCATQNVPGCPRVGFSLPLDVAALGLSAGPHTLQVQITNTRGAFVKFPDTPIPFTVDAGQSRQPYGKIELPKVGDSVSGSVRLTGYAVADDLRILSLDTLIDGVTYGPTTYGLPRPDVCNALTTKPPNCPNVGFQINLTTVNGFPPIPDGKHTVQMRVRDESGRLTLIPDSPIAITVSNGSFPIIGVLESPTHNEHLSGTVTLSGYAYSPGDKIASGLVIADNFFSYGTVKYGVARPDVCSQLPDVKDCPNIGFTFEFDTKRLSNGPHTLGVLFFNAHGEQLIIPNLVNGGMNVFVEN